MHEYKKILLDRINTFPIFGIPKWLSGNNDILNWLMGETHQYQPKNIMHRIYIMLNGPPPICSQNNPLQFNTFTTGYRIGCVKGNKCKCIAEKRVLEQKKTLQKLYGVDNPYQITEVKEKIKNINRHLYGVDYPSQNEVIKDKMVSTKNKRTLEQKELTKIKTQKTSLEKYGDIHHMKISSQHDKLKNTNQEKYGVDYPLQQIDILQKMKNTRKQSQSAINEKTKKTIYEKYGVDAVSRINLSEKAKNILFDKQKFIDFVIGKERNTVLVELEIAAHTLYLYAKKYNATDLFKHPLHSKFEIEIAKWLDETKINYQQNCRNIILPKELDFYIPEKNIAIECGGLYWHSENSAGRTRNYHHQKFTACKEKNVQLITIFEDEWQNKQAIVKTILTHALGLTKNKIHARKCKIIIPEKNEVKDFLERNHIQGSTGYKIAIGLQYENTLVAIMTFGLSRYNKKYQWELLRYCSTVPVIGGSSKLFKYFIASHNPDSVVSYSDSRWFTGSIYSILGFKQNSTTIGYQYTDYKKRIDRQNFQKHKLVEQGQDSSKSEWEIMQKLKYDRIWDCGQICWTINFDK